MISIIINTFYVIAAFLAAVYLASAWRPRPWVAWLGRWLLSVMGMLFVVLAFYYVGWGVTPLDLALMLNVIFTCGELNFWEKLTSSCADRMVRGFLSREGLFGAVDDI